MRTPKFVRTGKHKCANCGKVHSADQLFDIDRLSERVEAGGEVPSGECPDIGCGALCYPVRVSKKKPKLKVPVLIDRHLADISNAHMTLKDSEILHDIADSIFSGDLIQTRAVQGMIVHEYNEGFFVFCGSHMLPKKSYGFSEEFIRVCQIACKQGFAYINFDADSDKYEELKEFDW